MDDVEDQIRKIILSLDSVIMTIPVMGPLEAGMILGEIGDVHRFSNPGKLLAFAGLDPTVRQSGKSSKPVGQECQSAVRGSCVMLWFTLPTTLSRITVHL